MNKLALFGGEKAVNSSLSDISAPLVAERAYKTVEEMMRKGEISTSPLVGQFEKRFAEYIGVPYGLCVVNGTTSIQAALFAVGVGEGDEVIVPSFTFWATAGPIAVNGAYPVFADVDEKTHNISPESIEKLITKKTKAILLVHVWGNPCDMDAIMAIAKKYDLKVVEDCSHAHGATYKGKKVGSIGDVGCFSMQGSKVLAAGEGGILVTKNKTYYDRAVSYGHYDRCGGLGADSEYSRYWLTGFGYKHRVNPLGIAIADANLDKLDELNEIRYKNGKKFEELISDLPFINFQKEPDGAKRVFAYHYGQYIPEKFGNVELGLFLRALAAEGVACGSCGYGKLHLAPLYTKDGPFAKRYPFSRTDFPDTAKAELPTTEKLSRTAFMLAPRFEVLCDKALEEYSAAYHKVAENIEELIVHEKQTKEKEEIKNNGRSINYVKV